MRFIFLLFMVPPMHCHFGCQLSIESIEYSSRVTKYDNHDYPTPYVQSTKLMSKMAPGANSIHCDFNIILKISVG